MRGGDFDLRALSKTDRQDIGASYDTWSSVTLHEGEPGEWYAREPEACRDGGGGDFTCEDWYATNLNHDNAGRAYYSGGYYSVGADDYLGGVSGVYTWVRETASGFYEAGQCEYSKTTVPHSIENRPGRIDRPGR